MSVHSDYVIGDGSGYLTPACSCGWRGAKTKFGAESVAALHALYAEQGPTLEQQHHDRVAAERWAEFEERARLWAEAS